VLDAASEFAIDVPSLCADPRLAPVGACRLCVVAVEGRERPVAACTEPAIDGMAVRTHTPEIDALRRTLLGMLARDYPSDALVSPDEPFHRQLIDHGVAAGAAGLPDAALVDDSHPLIHVDLAQCISCWRCVRVCDEVQGQFVWQIANRGADSIVTPVGGALGDSPCVACGACVDTCPTGALEDRHLVGVARPTEWTRTTCPYCGVGCEMMVGTSEGAVVTIEPALDAPVNRGHLCVKGRYGFDFLTAPDRQTQPMIRDGQAWRVVSWPEAVGEAARQLNETRDTTGADSVGVLGSARATNEDNYLIQKLARAVLGTNNIDCCARVCHAPSAAALRTMLGTGAATNSFDDIEAAATIVVVGANATENHPIVGARIKQAKLRGAKLIVVDPRLIELASYADVHLRPRPGSNVEILNALAATIVDEDLVDHEFIAERVDGFDEFRSFIGSHTPEAVSDRCGVEAEQIRAAARIYATAKPAMLFHGLGVTEHRQGTEGVMALANLAMVTGNLGKPGSGVNPLRGQNNVQGAAHMGCEPAHLPGYAELAEAAGRVSRVWGAEVPRTPGLDAMEMLDAAGRRDVRALVVAGWDLASTQPDMTATRAALGALDHLVVIDLFLNETARDFATVFLPAAASFEKDGTFMNSERRVQRVRKAVDPPSGARPDWSIVCDLAAALDRGDLFAYRDASEIWEEIRRVWPPGAGITADRLDRPGGVQWPCPTEGHPGTTLLHAEQFAGIGPRATLRRIAPEPVESPTEQFPFLLVTGRSLSQFNAGTMTGRSATAQLRPSDRAEIHPSDAATLDIGHGDPIRLRSEQGTIALEAELTDRVSPGIVFTTFQDPAASVNLLTGPQRDRYTHTPEYKRTMVSIERVRVAADERS
jgi:formate dehydrogenase major subunit